MRVKMKDCLITNLEVIIQFILGKQLLFNFLSEVLDKRYMILQKLGWGHFSTVWLAKDLKYGVHVAMKIQKSASHYSEAAYDEVEILDVIANNTNNPEWVKAVMEYYKNEPEKLANGVGSEHCHTVQLLNSFMFYGPNGKHFVMVFEI